MVHMKSIEVEWKGERVKAWGLSLNGACWVHFDGAVFEVVEAQPSAMRSKQKVQSGNQIKAPMPGKIIKIAANVGDSVSQGQVLAIMEAMKMEYTLKAPRDGKVQSIPCAVNQQVALNQVLVVLNE